MLSLFVNLALAVLALGAVAVQAGRHTLRHMLRYFTVLSNLLCALSALAVALMRALGALWAPVLLLKFAGTAAVSVTLATVLVFLGPQHSYKALLSGPDFWLHLACPLLAIVSWLLWDRIAMPDAAALLLGLLPVVLYGLFYLHRVVTTNRWDDFYGFNRDGKWPRSFAAMVAGAALLSLLLSVSS